MHQSVRRMGKAATVAVVALLSLSFFVSCSQKQATDTSEIKVGIIAPLSGPIAVYGTQALDGIKLAVEQINAAGGVDGKKLQLIVEDDEGNPEKSINAYKKLTTKDGVSFIIGSLSSGCTAAFASLAEAQGTVVIAPAATAPGITEAGSHIFRMCFIDPFQGQIMGVYAAKNAGFKTAAILYDTGNDYSAGLMESFKAAFEAHGGKVVAEESYNTGDKDFNAQLTKIASTKPDCVYLPDYYGVVSLIGKQLRAQGITAQLLGGDGWAGLQGQKGDELLGSLYSDHYASDSTDQKVSDFVKAFNKKYGSTPNAFAALSFDAVYALKDAIEKAKSTDGEKVRDALAHLSAQYVTGNLRFDEMRNPIKAVVIIEFTKGSDGMLVSSYKDTVNP